VHLLYAEKREEQVDSLKRLYLLFLHLPVIVIIVSGLVFGFRLFGPHPCADIPNDVTAFLLAYPNCSDYTLSSGL